MSSEESEAAVHEKEFTIVVDTVEHTVDDETVTWKQVVEIAYPNSKPHASTLVKGGSVEVKKKGTTFSVLRSVVS
jgi:hypothetical protein